MWVLSKIVKKKSLISYAKYGIKKIIIIMIIAHAFFPLHRELTPIFVNMLHNHYKCDKIILVMITHKVTKDIGYCESVKQ